MRTTDMRVFLYDKRCKIAFHLAFNASEKYTNMYKIKIVCSLIAREPINRFHQNCHAYPLKPKTDFRKVKTPQNYTEFESRKEWFL
jgi:hypothetical protein